MLTRFIANSPISGTGAAVVAPVLSAAFLWVAPVHAQTQSGVYPWERNADSFLNRGLPKIDDPVEREIRDSIRRLGLPAQPSLDPSEPVPEPETPGLSEYYLPRMDSDRDGAVSRDEYFATRDRGRTVGDRGMSRYLQRRARIDSRFRNADRNRDGKLSEQELDDIRNIRF